MALDGRVSSNGNQDGAATPADVAGLPPGSYWEAHAHIGDVPLSADGKIAVHAVLRDGAWYVRLRAYRLARRGPKQEWVAARQIMIFPTQALEGLVDLLAAAGDAISAAPAAGLPQAELAREAAAELPDREALSLIIPGLFDETLASVADLDAAER